jgi:hypothetical protein
LEKGFLFRAPDVEPADLTGKALHDWLQLVIRRATVFLTVWSSESDGLRSVSSMTVHANFLDEVLPILVFQELKIARRPTVDAHDVAER